MELSPCTLFIVTFLFFFLVFSLSLIPSTTYSLVHKYMNKCLTMLSGPPLTRIIAVSIFNLIFLFCVLFPIIFLLFHLDLTRIIQTISRSASSFAIVLCIWVVLAFFMATFFMYSQSLSENGKNGRTVSGTSSHHIARKFYHIVAFLCFATPTVLYPKSSLISILTSFALAVSLSLFYGVNLLILSVLCIHKAPDSPLTAAAESIKSALSSLLDSRDNPLFPTSHISLLLGCLVPYLFMSEVLFPNMQPSVSLLTSHPTYSHDSHNPSAISVPLLHIYDDLQGRLSFCTIPEFCSTALSTVLQLSGALSVGIGDAFAAIVGRLVIQSSERSAATRPACIRPHRWPKSHRTIEGSLSMVLSMQFTMFDLIIFTLVKSSSLSVAESLLFAFNFTWKNPRMWGSTLLTALVEAYCTLNDNLILPVVFFSSVCAFHFFVI